MYILLICGSTVLFSFQFLSKKLLQKQEGSAPEIVMLNSLVGYIFSILVLFIRGKAAFGFTWFSFLIAFLHSVRGTIAGYVGIKVLEKANLSVYSLFSQLGGMLLPFFYAILFCGEQLTWQKSICAPAHELLCKYRGCLDIYS